MHDPEGEHGLWARAVATAAGSRYWRSALELVDPEGFAAASAGEFPRSGGETPAWVLGRRELIGLLGASAALAGLGGCAQRPREKILPYAQRPPEVTPGVPLRYATSMVLDGFATGLLVESREGRPTKVEGNPRHPASLGASGVYEQASVLELYDPARLQAPLHRGAPVSWAAVEEELGRPGDRPPWIVLPPQSSTLVAALIPRVRARHPDARFAFYTPLPHRAGYEATRRLLGRPLELQLRFDRADVVLALDADFLSSMPGALRYARDFAQKRRLADPAGQMNRLYVAETTLSSTGSLADHRLPLKPSDILALAAAVLSAVVAGGGDESLAKVPGLAAASTPGPHDRWVGAVARDLLAARGRSLVVAGERQPVETHVLALALNAALGNLGSTLVLTPPVLFEPLADSPLPELVEAIDRGQVDRVIVLEANPVYTAPGELELERRLRSVPHTFHLTLVANETSRACRWVLPATHYLEQWGDARAFDGTLSMVQPLIAPLYPGRGMAEILLALAGEAGASVHELLRETYRTPLAEDFEQAWDELLKLGLLEDSALPPEKPPEPDWQEALQAADGARSSADGRRLELHLAPSPAVFDGRFSPNPWLLELPHPTSKQSWGNAALIGPATAVELGVESGQVLELSLGARTVRAPALVLPGHAERAITLELGYGRQLPGTAAHEVGVDAYRLLPARDLAHASGLSVRVTDQRDAPIVTQEHWALHGRPLALHATLPEYRNNPDFTAGQRGPQPSLLPAYRRTVATQPAQWAMTIDTTICSGCSACVVACQAENNIPVVGPEGVRRSREMYWLRIDRYFAGSPERPRVIHQPMLCQHCEKAPCEYVCPVNATVHSPDGLNEMVYNRCIGTRFCSNNCPYKVRRFNWFDYTQRSQTARMQWNPDVTVRDRGVMEKCTYCVQRIRRAEVRARTERRPLAPGDVVTACQQACPTGAIQFDSLHHRESTMRRWRDEPRRYAVLHDQGTRPRTQYLAKIDNPNPELAE